MSADDLTRGVGKGVRGAAGDVDLKAELASLRSEIAALDARLDEHFTAVNAKLTTIEDRIAHVERLTYVSPELAKQLLESSKRQ
jgi:hypothetical protein